MSLSALVLVCSSGPWSPVILDCSFTSIPLLPFASLLLLAIPGVSRFPLSGFSPLLSSSSLLEKSGSDLQPTVFSVWLVAWPMAVPESKSSELVSLENLDISCPGQLGESLGGQAWGGI